MMGVASAGVGEDTLSSLLRVISDPTEFQRRNAELRESIAQFERAKAEAEEAQRSLEGERERLANLAAELDRRATLQDRRDNSLAAQAAAVAERLRKATNVEASLEAREETLKKREAAVALGERAIADFKRQVRELPGVAEA